jgi:hypothetical protein
MNLSEIPPPFGSPINPPTVDISPPPPYPMSCVPWGFNEKMAVGVVAGSTWGLLVAILGISLYKRIANKPSLIKYNRRILTNMDTIPETQSMDDV